MDTKVIRMSGDLLDEGAIKEAGKLIRCGGLVAFPTETVYGLGGDALDGDAARRIYAAKGRPSDNPLIIHIADMESLDRIVKEVPQKARELAKAFWPGPLTMIFRKGDVVPYETTGGLDSVAVRMPNHKIALAFIRAAGGYVSGPSANTSGRPSPTTAGHVYEDLKGIIPCILDGGQGMIGIESTIVDFTEEIPTILRPGFINQEMLESVIGKVQMDQGLLDIDPNLRPKAPGMKYRHYAPKGNLVIVEGEDERVIKKINSLAKSYVTDGKSVGIIGTDETISYYEHGVIKSIGSRNQEESIAQHLYGVLREFDDEKVEFIFSESFATPKMGQAIMNRLLKAAGHQTIKV